jgi:hypothetical protein
VLHLLSINRYGYHRDELYFLDCATNLDWGYFDHPPLLESILAATRWALGDSLTAIRFPALIASTLLVILVAAMAKELGGGRFAQLLSGLAALFAPVYLITSAMASVEGLNALFWAVCLYMTIRILKEPTRGRWLAIGAVFGLGLLAKYAIAFLGVALAAGILLSARRNLLRAPWPWAGVGLALFIFSPNLIWQWSHGWPFLTYAARIHATMMQWIPVHLYLLFQLLYLGPLSLPLWLAGLAHLLLSETMKPFRMLGIAFVAVMALLIGVGSKPYYPAPAYTVLFAAGGVAAERYILALRWNWMRPVSATVLVVTGLIFLPYSLPILPIEKFLAYSRVVYLEGAFTFETGRIIPLPQYFADMFGWESQVEVVSRVYHSLPEQERAKTIIYGDNYGEAGAINLFGRNYSLPRAVSHHFNYYYWGPGPTDTQVVIAFGGVDLEDLERDFADVSRAATISHPYAIFYENEIPVFVCRKPRLPVHELWNRER